MFSKNTITVVAIPMPVNKEGFIQELGVNLSSLVLMHMCTRTSGTCTFFFFKIRQVHSHVVPELYIKNDISKNESILEEH